MFESFWEFERAFRAVGTIFLLNDKAVVCQFFAVASAKTGKQGSGSAWPLALNLHPWGALLTIDLLGDWVGYDPLLRSNLRLHDGMSDGHQILVQFGPVVR